jgi:hypothetical protein
LSQFDRSRDGPGRLIAGQREGLKATQASPLDWRR